MLHALRSSLATAILSLGLAACGANVVVDGNAGDLGQGVGLGQGEGGGTPGGGGTAGGAATSTGTGTGTATATNTSEPPHPTPALPPAIAMRYGDVPGGGGGVGGGAPGQDPVTPDDTFLVVSGYGAACDNPYGPGGCVLDWRLFVVIPAAKLAPGAVFDLPHTNAWFNATQPGPGDACSGAAGSVPQGVLTIGALLADGSISGSIDGLDVFMDGVPASTAFTAVRCVGASTPDEPPPDQPACGGTGANCTSNADCCNDLCNAWGHCDP